MTTSHLLFRRCRKALRYDVRSMASVLGIGNERTVRRWEMGEVQAYARYLSESGESVEDVAAILAQHGIRQATASGELLEPTPQYVQRLIDGHYESRDVTGPVWRLLAYMLRDAEYDDLLAEVESHVEAEGRAKIA